MLAIAVAKIFPESAQLKRAGSSNLEEPFSLIPQSRLSEARTILAYAPAHGLNEQKIGLRHQDRNCFLRHLTPPVTHDLGAPPAPSFFDAAARQRTVDGEPQHAGGRGEGAVDARARAVVLCCFGNELAARSLSE